MMQDIESEPITKANKRTRLNNGVRKRPRIMRTKEILYTTVDKSANTCELMKEPRPIK